MITKCKWYLFYTLGYRSLRLQRQIISNFTHLSQILRLKLRDLSLTLALDACLPFPRPFAAHVLLSNNLSCQPYISNSFCLFLFCNPSQRYSYRASIGDKTFFFHSSHNAILKLEWWMVGCCQQCTRGCKESTLPFRSDLTNGETQSNVHRQMQFSFKLATSIRWFYLLYYFYNAIDNGDPVSALCVRCHPATYFLRWKRLRE